LRRYELKSVEVGVFGRGGSLWVQISGWRGVPTIAFGVSKLEWLPFHMALKYWQYAVWFCHKARLWQTDRRTDRITTPKTALAWLRRAVKTYPA